MDLGSVGYARILKTNTHRAELYDFFVLVGTERIYTNGTPGLPRPLGKQEKLVFSKKRPNNVFLLKSSFKKRTRRGGAPGPRRPCTPRKLAKSLSPLFLNEVHLSKESRSKDQNGYIEWDDDSRGADSPNI